MKTAVATLAATAALLSLDGHAGVFATIGGGASDWPDCGSGAVSCDHKDGTWFGRVGFGIPLVPFLGVEARYVDLGRNKSSLPFANVPIDTTVESKGAGVGAVLQVPIPLDLALNAVAGFARMKGSVTQHDAIIGTTTEGGVVTSVGFSGSRTKTNPYYGIGIDYRLNNSNFSVGAEATRYRVDFGSKDNVDTYTLSFTYRFL